MSDKEKGCRLSIRLSREQVNRIEDIAEKEGKTKSQVIREFIQEDYGSVYVDGNSLAWVEGVAEKCDMKVSEVIVYSVLLFNAIYNTNLAANTIMKPFHQIILESKDQEKNEKTTQPLSNSSNQASSSTG